ncbi:MAG: translation initiation factor IF-1 [Bryobacterales bacterium]|nr:translation initiation factor IF-1 [Bryobacterales bacterium]
MKAERTVEATVVEELPNAVYRLEVAGRHRVLGHPAGARVRNFVRLLPGDRVEVVLSGHDLTRGRITKKL